MPSINLTITGTGSYLPATVLNSTDIDDRMGWARGECEARFGIARRHVAMPDETSSFMGAEAARRAMEMAGCGPQDLDLILGACGVMEQPIPSTATLVQDRLGLGRSGIAAFDVNATCLSFLQALDLAALHVQCGRVRRALVFSSDIASVGLDWNRPEAAAIFGDGAAAVVVEAGGKGAVLAHDFQTYAHGHDACVLAAGGTRVNPARGIAPGEDRFRMDGGKAFKLASRYLPRFLQRLLQKAGVGLAGIGCIIPHQASAQALQHAARNLWLPPGRVIDIFARTGNQIAASIPTALDHAVRSGRLVRGDVALLMGTSAGISVGGMMVRF
ncbi:3-oxoacyl-[acyl-carrier-protein] synthase III C-terminal domain-containing protein [Paracoccus denitrificans]|jgi:3-oxoacyl-[acyl-carrier-protein] synthase-3|uniref:3-oxoacyl-[acyl-carrier-protein] synthase III n=1 Tax=Paracoccus denitrificans (strain Pd 1222) TaxID=318586 RepID=A1AZT7_PARDP|nr:3-oxoacyl-[acyl-carrier-protein] synthase III C-terminal domain-containing protein [Paracoccus denitrificans]ABL68781.1 3-oxoacyl-[acyl-carrier-protein] synthase III [Paracoccus denitrificans PD1222]MBB4625493.1 3-oxoacyl-[acyl-carrier-protein] synthase-3 [Paracoccus denitrificans]MCU7427338.1 ketoacyl-ACP synthase III [Paracoccus denitrificans]QAR26832.1 ketoacyl-ACP synthase III [Paracoccus denitrificans]UPV95787.1 ketoacyl-ACP synthase III [Paracoccus denitrificans]